ncbi:MAG: TROVE domain-containing protein [Bacteroides sp.]|nr:TROVE domain-containing protein [Bacteroides sp.]
MKFNLLNRGKNRVQNLAGANAYRLSPEWELYTSVVTTSLNNSFYEQEEERIARVRNLIGSCDPLFVARLAVYARTAMNLRSIPLVMAVELARVHKGDDLVRRLTAQTIRRADEITELLAYYQQANQRTGTKKLNRLSKQLQAGLQDAFNAFDAYQFAKYNRDSEVRLRDALFLVHPKAKDGQQQEVFNEIVSNSLPTPYTWETELSAVGQNSFATSKEKAAAFRAKWEELIDSEKLGYMALLRNLRNLLEAEVSGEHILKVGNKLASEKAVESSKQLPFRFLAAYRELSKTPSLYATMLMTALERAVQVSARNITGFDDSSRILIACDVSGSMQYPISPKSKIMRYDIGLMLGMLLKSRCAKVMTGIFGDRWKLISLPDTGILSNVDAFYKREGEVGYSTNGYLVIKDLIERRAEIDKVMMFTDCQLWNNNGNFQLEDQWKEYKKICPKAKLYLFDLAGYGNTPLDITREDVYLIAGWSDKIFNLLSAIDNGSDALTEIKRIEV